MSVPMGHLELLKKCHTVATLFVLDQGLISAGPGLRAKEKTRIYLMMEGLPDSPPKLRSHPRFPGERRGGEQIMSIWVV